MKRTLLSIFMLMALMVIAINANAVAAPTGLASQDVINTTATLTWNSATDAVKYNVLQDALKIGSTTGLVIQVTGLVPGVSYSFTVESVDIFDNTSAPSGALIVVGNQDGGIPGNIQNVYVVGGNVTTTAGGGGGGGGDASAANQTTQIGIATTSDASLSSIDGKLVNGNDIGDVTINNASGASAVNIQDGGNSITVDGSVSVASSALPTGAATSVLQTTGNASLVSIDGKTPALGAATVAGSSPVTMASDQPAIPVSAASLPLPTGAATFAGQGTGNGILSLIESDTTSIDGKLGSLGQKTMAGSAPVVLASDQSAVPVSASSLPLPTGAATAANQTTGNGSLSSIDGKLGSLGQKTMAGSQPVAIASNQSAIPVIAISSSLPAGAATAVNQTTANTSLGNIDDKIPSASNTVTQRTVITAATTETTILTAGGLGVFHDISMIFVSNPDANTDLKVTFRDATAGSIVWEGEAASGGGGFVIPFPVALPQTTADNNWTAEIDSGASPGVIINVVGHVRQ